MGDLAADSAVEGRDGRYRARVSSEWEIWGPNGGYVAALALRAAAAQSRLPRPATFACHFLGTAEFDEVDLTVTILRSAKRAESLRVSMTQNERPVLEALAWFVSDSDGLAHDVAVMPDVPGPDELKSWEDLGFEAPYPFWRNVEARSIGYTGPWEDRTPGEPAFQQWYRFRPRATFEDPVVEAARLMIVLDIIPWPAATRASTGKLPFIAPNLDLTVRFHRTPGDAEWLLGEGEAPIAEDGLISGTARVWSQDGKLLASGEQQMLCRPAPD
jgi:acyl-CoA thioesterase II